MNKLRTDMVKLKLTASWGSVVDNIAQYYRVFVVEGKIWKWFIRSSVHHLINSMCCDAINWGVRNICFNGVIFADYYFYI